MSKLCNHYESFVKQEIAEIVTEALEVYQQLDNVSNVLITEDRIIIEFKEEV